MVSSLDVRPHFFSGHNRSTSVSSISSTQASYSTSPASKMASTGAQSYTLALQKYMLLTEQHQELCDHLDQIRPEFNMSIRSHNSSPSTSPTRSSSSSLSLPPSPKRHSRSGRHHSRSHARCSGWEDRNELTTIPDEETIYEISAEEQRLSEVNESIKRTLTELLNCSSVRADRAFRTWVQTRLMETEKELRSGRRRRSSGNE
ncbi:hypothetical protein FOQG_10576 [Fusarium oxysporum f. sp. raphani 54005]|uniref:Uncharacterized protein n=4 Tax=Fusarium oxysporum TaxID=5507 RepID=X0BUB5_FUSOX|nr:hypothetical protein FOVG_11496 [Fusarium oxysporum f. sp. pisi HDV247]EXK85495.1 hypothetical protein FOQG_10576 [Fusarium oxysporum f. sp. raphani 54005]KAJ4032254.1 hypothetical protein NW758_011932 [Fusarium oxysporum]EXA37216.1 hypothetical protein FOVG_11496 [Fusarium oxysporum f. sp. pisi HDV247]EXK85496.1 hypothetical protein FOQG_10576 [Fusarium oxysporum f. sp. raphani 54005]